ncbi:cytochrome c biogenesis protein ResB [Mycobacterium leprae]|nr:cytochrome c biogenesis protein ResB [Mycobacterium leprae]
MLAFAIAMIVGLGVSLIVRCRRVWGSCCLVAVVPGGYRRGVE